MPDFHHKLIVVGSEKYNRILFLKILLSYLVYIHVPKTWWFYLMDDHHFGYITKSLKKDCVSWGLNYTKHIIIVASKVFSMLGKYKEKCENRKRFQGGFQFESFRVSHWVMPFKKSNSKVLYNVRTRTLKP